MGKLVQWILGISPYGMSFSHVGSPYCEQYDRLKVDHELQTHKENVTKCPPTLIFGANGTKKSFQGNSYR